MEIDLSDVFIVHDAADVEFDYEPAERQTWDCPGNPESVSVTSLKFRTIELVDVLTDAERERVECLILENIRYEREQA